MAQEKQKENMSIADIWTQRLEALFIRLGSPLEHDNSKVGQRFITIYKKPSNKTK